MEKIDRLQKVIAYYAHGNVSEFARMIGVKEAAVAKWVERGSYKIEPIATNCPNLNLRWFVTGEGEMFEHRQAKASQTAPASENFSAPSQADSPACASSSPVSSPIPSELTQVMNEFLSISHTLTQQIAEGQRILTKSQQLFEQIVSMQRPTPRPYTTQEIMVSEPDKKYNTK